MALSKARADESYEAVLTRDKRSATRFAQFLAA
jgi:hypothetical protein